MASRPYREGAFGNMEQEPKDGNRESPGAPQPQQPYGQNPYRNPQRPCGQGPYQGPYRNPQRPYGQPPYYAPQPPSPEMRQRAAQSWLRQTGNRAALLPIFMNLFAVCFVGLLGGIWGASNVRSFLLIYRQGGYQALLAYLSSQRGFLIVLSILSTCLAVIVTILIARSTLRQKVSDVWKRPQCSRNDLLKWLVLALGAAGAGSLLSDGLSALFKFAGLKLASPDFNLSGSRNADIIMAAYVCVIGPVLEETLFRGMILQSLRPWGDWFAVVTSSVLFGLAHMNLVQGIPAVLLGIVFGFITVKSGSILPSAILHIINNTLSIVMLTNGIAANQTLQNVYMGILIAAMIGSVLLLAFRRINFRGVTERPVSAPPVAHRYRTVFLQSASFWVLVACFALFSLYLSGAATGLRL